MSKHLSSNIAFLFIKPLLHCVAGSLLVDEKGVRRFKSGSIITESSDNEYVKIGRGKGLLVCLDKQMTFAGWLSLDDGIAGKAFRLCQKHFPGDIEDESHFMALISASYWMLESGFSLDSQPNSFYLHTAKLGYEFHDQVSRSATSCL